MQQLTPKVQKVIGETVEVAFVDESYTWEKVAQAAEGEGIRLEVIKLPDVKNGFVLLPRRWVVDRVLVGQRVFTGWRRIANACRKP